MENLIPPLGYRSRYPAPRSHPPNRYMTDRGYSLLDTPLDLHASIETLICNYELVRQNIEQIAPFLPNECVIELIAGGTPHNAGKIPLLWDARFTKFSRHLA